MYIIIIFLGLTEEEIQMAIDQSGVSNVTVQAPAVPPPPHTLNSYQNIPPAIPEKQCKKFHNIYFLNITY